MRTLLFIALASFAVSPSTADDALEPIAIVGTGEVGSALGTSWGRLGHPIVYGSRSPDSAKTRELLSRSGNARAVASRDAARHADIVVLALPFTAALELVPQMGDLRGKILIDPMNALRFDREQARVDTYDELLAEQIQALAPGAHVVKALNALNARNMAPDREFAGPISVPIAGDDPRAKRKVAELIERLGLEAADVGPLFNARYVEAMAPLYVYMNFFARPAGGFEYHIARSRRPSN